MTVITRFAPSPTGFLHIGSARTALFNWLFARHHKGKFLLRIEDTDKARSTKEAIDAILEGMDWLGLKADEPYVLQSANDERHREVAHTLLARGRAYHCYASPVELEKMRQESKGYNGLWRDRDPSEAPAGVKPVIRLKAPQTGATTVHDMVQGEVTVQNSQLDDMVLLRSDDSPTYMLSVVVDDHDAGITHVIRGDDHLNNTFRQIQLYRSMEWDLPHFAHIPLIHGEDGAKMSKRHGSVSLTDYIEMGILSDAMLNYLLRLGWSHGNDEIITRMQAIEWFDLAHVSKGPSRFDMKKLESTNAHYLKNASDDFLMAEIFNRAGIQKEEPFAGRIQHALAFLKEKPKNLNELAASAGYLLTNTLCYDEGAKALKAAAPHNVLKDFIDLLGVQDDFKVTALQEMIQQFLELKGLQLKDMGPYVRAALTGTKASPGNLVQNLSALGKEESLKRLKDFVAIV